MIPHARLLFVFPSPHLAACAQAAGQKVINLLALERPDCSTALFHKDNTHFTFQSEEKIRGYKRPGTGLFQADFRENPVNAVRSAFWLPLARQAVHEYGHE